VRVLAVKDLPADRIEPDLRHRLLAVIADPNVAYMLLMLGFYGLLFELQNPGAILPGIVGGICLILALLALSTLPVSFAGVALIVLGIGFFLAEIKVMSHGLLAVGGVVSFVLGSLILFRGEIARVSWTLIALVTLTTLGFFLFVIGAGLRAQRSRVRSGAKGLVGERAQAVDRLAPDGLVRVGGELWRAVSESEVGVGGNVEITGVEGLTLRVRPLAKEAGS
jgi:membrane-bound serine protease (ClpP class)